MTNEELILRLKDELEELRYQLPHSLEQMIVITGRIMELERLISEQNPTNQ